MDEWQLKELIDKYLAGECTPEERILVEQWYEGLPATDAQFYNGDQSLVDASAKKSLQAVWQKIKTAKTGENGKLVSIQSDKRNWTRYAAAAAIILAITTGVLLYLQPTKPNKMEAAAPVKNDVMPGGNKATLTLADGSTIVLDNVRNGLIGEQGKTSIIKTSDGQLTYNSETERTNEALLNTISTPNGGQYMVTLSDGTRVWLNAASSLHFPARFGSGERRVALTGEAYFEVTHDSHHPFIVNVEDMEVHDLGTEFNINGYYNEPIIQTTLVKGRASVKLGDKSAFLVPGNAAVVKGSNIEIETVDVAEATAWKNGMFRFSNADVKAIMRQIARWYDVNVSFEGKMPDRKLTGEAPRNTTLSTLLKVLELNDIHFKLEGKRITVLP